MARGSQTRSEKLLAHAIEDVQKVVNSWKWLVIGLGIAGTIFAMGALLGRLLVFLYFPNTLNLTSLVSALAFVILASVLVIAFKIVEQQALTQISNYVAGRLAVPAVMASAQRAGRPETLANVAIRDVEAIRTAMSGPGSEAVVHAVVTPPLLALAFILHWSYGALAVFFCVAAGILSLLITRAEGRASEHRGEGRSSATGLAADAMRSGEAVLAMGMLPRLTGQWIETTTAAAGDAWIAEREANRLRTVLEVLLGSYRVTFIVVGAILALNGEVTTALAVGTLFIMMRIPEPFIVIGDHAREIAEGTAAWRRLKALVGDSNIPADGLDFPCHQGRLVVERMSFGFRGPHPPLFRGLELTVEPGEIVAIIGASGSGKSTLLRLLIGLYRPSSGGIYLDGCAVAQWDRRELARHLGFLPQEPLLSRGTAAEVIARLEPPEMPRVIDAARRAGAHETILRLELGYATLIAGQHQLSMGQRHRLAIARALYGRPRIVVMDELAASLDAEGEAEVGRLLEVLREEGTSVIFTTHRPGLLAAADRVLAIRNGTLVAATTQDQAAPRLARTQQRLAQPVAAGAAPPGGGRAG